ncbi:MAG: hypothetical protein ACQKBU_10505 [Verrucomicrobiales bacterium]
MNEADYATAKCDTISRLISLGIMLFLLGLKISDGNVTVWYKFEAVPVFATAFIWFSNTLGGPLPWANASRVIRIVGWFALTVSLVFVIL